MMPKPKPGQRSALEEMRGRTDYTKKRPSGYAPLFDAALADAARLADGSAFKILMFVWNMSLGRRVDADRPFLEETEPVSVAKLAELARCDQRTAERELNGLAERKVIKRTKVKNGQYVLQPLFRTWEHLPDYAPRPQTEPDDEAVTDNLPAKTTQTTHIIETPVYVRAGKKSKRVEVPCEVTAFECQVKGKVDAECSAMVQDGVLRVILEGKWDGKTLGNGSLKQKGIDANERQGCRPSPKETTGKGTKGERGTKSETSQAVHPRAVELSNLFDPLIFKWCKKTLSGDSVALLRACEAIGDTPHDEVVRAAVERGGRTLTPLHVPSVCKEIAHNWEKAKGMPPEKRLPTREEIDAMIAVERKELAEKNAAARRGRVA